MLYELFMVWAVGSITAIVASMVRGGLLCVWCAFKGSKRARLDAASLLVHRHPSPPAPSSH